MCKRALFAFALLGVFVAANMVLAEEGGEKTVAGKVKVTKDGAKVTAVELVAGEVVTKVKVDAKGEELAKEDGKEVEAKGTIKDNVLTVTSFKPTQKLNIGTSRDAHREGLFVSW
jgi:hypothetical protein